MDSEVICAYLDSEMGDGRLGHPLEGNWDLKTLHSVCAGLTDTLVLLRVEKGREQEGLRSDFWWQRYQSAIGRTLEYLAQRLYLLPPELTLAHINLACALGYLDFRHPEIDWRSGRPELALLADELEARESFAVTTLRD